MFLIHVSVMHVCMHYVGLMRVGFILVFIKPMCAAVPVCMVF